MREESGGRTAQRAGQQTRGLLVGQMGGASCVKLRLQLLALAV